MKRNYWAIGCVVLALLVLVKGAYSDIVGTLPYTLTNNTLADANQVMANFNAIVSGVNGNAATSGANSNITSLNGLTTPLSYTGGGTPYYVAGSSTGSGNAQVVSTAAPNGFTLVTGKTIVFVAGYTNSGPTTLNVASTGVTNVYRQSTTGPVALAGGEIVVGNLVTATFDGTQFQIQNQNPQQLVPVGAMQDFATPVLPSGWLLADGTTKSRTTYANLNAALSRTAIAATTSSGSKSVVVPDSTLFQVGWMVSGTNVACSDPILSIPDSTHVNITTNATGSGSTTLQIGPYAQGDCSTTFTLPNFVGRLTAGVDGTSRITSATCANSASLGSYCGAQNETFLQAYLPNVNFTVTGTFTGSSGGNAFVANTYTTNSGAIGTWTQSGSALPVSGTISGNAASGGSGTALPLLNPVGLVYKAIKY